jgi:flagellar biosynthesis protein FlhG
MGNDCRARRYAIVSGKGGVGKTVITANLAAALAGSGLRTLVVDADLGLANLDIIMGINPAGTIQDVLAGKLTANEALVHTRGGFDLLPAGSGFFESTLLTPDLATSLEKMLEGLDPHYDAILFDVGAGIGDVVLFFARIADDVVLVVTPELTSLIDAYATIKILALRYGCKNFRLVVNQADPDCPEQSGKMVAAHLQQIASKFLSDKGGTPVRLHFAGALPVDPAISRAISRQQLLVETDPDGPVASLLPRLAASLRAAPPGSPRTL